ncbi:uncharacterized protein LOC121923720 isoform X2 [Sceloporus undulatus]|nr:uncharacterized protein LOC121923720 isoform X2 [Sceloporus undulatus]
MQAPGKEIPPKHWEELPDDENCSTVEDTGPSESGGVFKQRLRNFRWQRRCEEQPSGEAPEDAHWLWSRGQLGFPTSEFPRGSQSADWDRELIEQNLPRSSSEGDAAFLERGVPGPHLVLAGYTDSRWRGTAAASHVERPSDQLTEVGGEVGSMNRTLSYGLGTHHTCIQDLQVLISNATEDVRQMHLVHIAIEHQLKHELAILTNITENLMLKDWEHCVTLSNRR